jgi:hypothetical protein
MDEDTHTKSGVAVVIELLKCANLFNQYQNWVNCLRMKTIQCKEKNKEIH